MCIFQHSNVCTVRTKCREDQAGTTTAASAWAAVGKCGGGKETDSRYFSEVESKELGGGMPHKSDSNYHQGALSL